MGCFLGGLFTSFGIFVVFLGGAAAFSGAPLGGGIGVVVGVSLVVWGCVKLAGKTTAKKKISRCAYIVEHFAELSEQDIGQAEQAEQQECPVFSAEQGLLYALRVSKCVPTLKKVKTLASRWDVANTGGKNYSGGLALRHLSPDGPMVWDLLCGLYLQQFDALCSEGVAKALDRASRRKSVEARLKVLDKAIDEIADSETEFAGLAAAEEAAAKWIAELERAADSLDSEGSPDNGAAAPVLHRQSVTSQPEAGQSAMLDPETGRGATLEPEARQGGSFPACTLPVSQKGDIMEEEKKSGFALAALLCGIGSMFTCGLTALPAVICGHIALSRVHAGTARGTGKTITGLVLGYASLGLLALGVLSGLLSSDPGSGGDGDPAARQEDARQAPSAEERATRIAKARAARAKAKEDFLSSIEAQYAALLALVAKKDVAGVMRKIGEFETHGQLDFKEVARIRADHRRQEDARQAPSAEEPTTRIAKARAARAKAKEDFLSAIEAQYAALLALVAKKDVAGVMRKTGEFEKYGQSDFKDVARIRADHRRQQLAKEYKALERGDYRGQLSIYEELVSLFPDSETCRAKRRALRTKVAEIDRQEQAAQDREEAELQRAEAQLRNAPRNSEWDASVKQVKRYLEATLNDAGSVKYVEWSTVFQTPNGWIVRCKYRAKNAFGGYVLKNQLFYMDENGAVVSVRDVR